MLCLYLYYLSLYHAFLFHFFLTSLQSLDFLALSASLCLSISLHLSSSCASLALVLLSPFLCILSLSLSPLISPSHTVSLYMLIPFKLFSLCFAARADSTKLFGSLFSSSFPETRSLLRHVGRVACRFVFLLRRLLCHCLLAACVSLILRETDFYTPPALGGVALLAVQCQQCIKFTVFRAQDFYTPPAPNGKKDSTSQRWKCIKVSLPS